MISTTVSNKELFSQRQFIFVSYQNYIYIIRNWLNICCPSSGPKEHLSIDSHGYSMRLRAIQPVLFAWWLCFCDTEMTLTRTVFRTWPPRPTCRTSTALAPCSKCTSENCPTRSSHTNSTINLLYVFIPCVILLNSANKTYLIHCWVHIIWV